MIVGGSGALTDGSEESDATGFMAGSASTLSGFFFPAPTGFSAGIDAEVASGSWAAAARGTM